MNCRHGNDIITVFHDGKVRYLCPKCSRSFILTHLKPLPGGVKPIFIYQRDYEL